ncbi:MAG: MFS transporter [Proteobacteria bacterium]|nr:MAG: MFS transporter [Pseudomonadota bacterium]PIE17931.1 MAG: MFS transporter [Pseudomonadota bacterium]
MDATPRQGGWSFSKAFWTANVVELLERAAWYGVFVAITLYLTRILGFSDMETGVIAGLFSAGLYLLPVFSGALADKIGFKRALLLAFALLSVGYASMWLLPALIEGAGLATYGEKADVTALSQTGYKWLFLPVMVVVMIGGSFIKSVITGTVAKETTEETRARGYSIFYAMVNVGAFSGKTIVKPLRMSMGDRGLVVLNLFAAGMTAVAFLLVAVFYKSVASDKPQKTLGEVGRALLAACKQVRLVLLMVIITGFWMVQHQLYATMPKYVLRMAGEGASPSWYANVNPAMVVLFVGLITQLMRRYTALTSMTVGMFIMPISAFCMAAGNLLPAGELVFGMHPVAFMMIVGIAFQGIAECFISPRYLEYFSLQAPTGEEGLYLGFSHLHSFLSSILGFSLSGVLLDVFCPARSKFTTAAAWRAAKAHAHYIWFVFVGIAVVSALSLIAFGTITRRIDANAANATNAATTPDNN